MNLRQGESQPFKNQLIQRIFGKSPTYTEILAETFPNYVRETSTIQPADTKRRYANSFEIDHTYEVKILTRYHLRLHTLLTKWRNMVYKYTQGSTPFASFETPVEMAKYEFELRKEGYTNGGAFPAPYEYADIPGTGAALLCDYPQAKRKLTMDRRSLKTLNLITKSLKQLHSNNTPHAQLSNKIYTTAPDSKPLITDPIGNVKPTPKARIQGVGFDLATLLIQFSPQVGTLPAIKTLSDHYSETELIAAHEAARPIQVASIRIPPWITTHIRSSIEEFTSPNALQNYQDIIEEDKEQDMNPAGNAPHPHPKNTVSEESEASRSGANERYKTDTEPDNLKDIHLGEYMKSPPKDD